MHQHKASITLNELIYGVIPNLNIAEKFVIATLDSLIETATHPLDIVKRTQQRQAFTLETHRIRLDLEHLLNRYRDDVDAILRTEGGHKGPLLAPDLQEQAAINGAMDIYLHVRAFQRGDRQHPVPGRIQ